MSKKYRKKRSIIKERERLNNKSTLDKNKDKKYISNMNDYIRVRIEGHKLGTKIGVVLTVIILILLMLTLN